MTPVFNYQKPAPQTFGLTGPELRAKRAAQKAARAKAEREREIAALVQRVESNKPRRLLVPLIAYEIHREILDNALALHAEFAYERGYNEMRDEMACVAIAESYRPLIEAARLESAGSAAKRKAKRDAKEAARRARAAQFQAA